MKVFTSFVIVGLICAIASIIYDTTKFTSGHITSLFVVTGAILGLFGIYDIWIKKYGYGLSLPITSFGNSLLKASYEGYKSEGIFGIFSQMFYTTGAGISTTIVFSLIMSLICKPKD